MSDGFNELLSVEQTSLVKHYASEMFVDAKVYQDYKIKWCSKLGDTSIKMSSKSMI
jgi:hypothetical protein